MAELLLSIARQADDLGDTRLSDKVAQAAEMALLEMPEAYLDLRLQTLASMRKGHVKRGK